MPTTQLLDFRSAYAARVTRGGETREHVVDDVFPVTVEVVKPERAIPVLTVKTYDTLREDRGPQIPFVEIDGKLHRPFTVEGKGGLVEGWNGFWSPERLAKSPPLLRLSPTRRLAPTRTTTLAPDPFDVDKSIMQSTDLQRRKARDADPQRAEDAHRRLQATADRLKLIGDTVYQETMPPGWKCQELGYFEASLSDADDMPLALVDPRHSRAAVSRMAKRHQRDARVVGSFEIHDAARIPDTFEQDALALHTARMIQILCFHKIGQIDFAFTRVAMDLLDEVEMAVAERRPFGTAYEILAKLGRMARAEDTDTRRLADYARLFLAALKECPQLGARRSHVPVPQADKEAIEDGFRM